MMEDLFSATPGGETAREVLGEGAVLMRRWLAGRETDVMAAIEGVAARAPFRFLTTPGGHVMSVAMTGCGDLGWHSDRAGYRYVATDPVTARPWPAMPDLLRAIAADAAAAAGYAGFAPEACLINRYEPGARLSLHQDKDEGALDQPIVSLSLGVAATFLWGGADRATRPRRLRLESGDVVVWGGPTRLNYHGVAPLAQGWSALGGVFRFNVTFRAVRKVARSAGSCQ